MLEVENISRYRAVRMIANLLEVDLTKLAVEVTGDLDVRGCLAANPDVRAGFEASACNLRLTAADGGDPRRLGALVTAAEAIVREPRHPARRHRGEHDRRVPRN